MKCSKILRNAIIAALFTCFLFLSACDGDSAEVNSVPQATPDAHTPVPEDHEYSHLSPNAQKALEWVEYFFERNEGAQFDETLMRATIRERILNDYGPTVLDELENDPKGILENMILKSGLIR